MHLHSKILLTLVFSLTTLVQAAPPEQDRKPRPVFSDIDTNSDGDISFEEFSARELPHGEHEEIFAIIDADNNGVISIEEFENHKPPRPKDQKEKRGSND